MPAEDTHIFGENNHHLCLLTTPSRTKCYTADQKESRSQPCYGIKPRLMDWNMLAETCTECSFLRNPLDCAVWIKKVQDCSGQEQGKLSAVAFGDGTVGCLKLWIPVITYWCPKDFLLPFICCLYKWRAALLWILIWTESFFCLGITVWTPYQQEESS